MPHIFSRLLEIKTIVFQAYLFIQFSYTFTDESHRQRDWDTHYHLIEGICMGLHYLHNKERIIHLDLKPANILLDAYMIPKITDFGLSRRFSGEQSRIITEHVRGTL